ncbi:hypothetical protein SAMN05216328_101729 [Ensifer sp. YR511]|nr:hypothetical protein SAMN05216328_101729 [Ensifer sp. YR511]
MRCLQRLSYARLLAVSALLANLAFFAPVKAMDEVRLQAAVASLGDGADAQRLEARVADLVKSGDQIELAKLAEQIRMKDGDFLDILAKFYEQPEQANATPGWQQIALSMGPCHYANAAIRIVAMKIANGTHPAIRNGVVMIDGTEVDNIFAESMHRCELIARLPKSTWQVGSSCAMTGDCADDPDLMEQQ